MISDYEEVVIRFKAYRISYPLTQKELLTLLSDDIPKIEGMLKLQQTELCPTNKQ